MIGHAGTMPWHLPEDLMRFKQLTIGKPVVMGRATYESIGHPLTERENIILTRQPTYRVPGCRVVHNMESAIRVSRGSSEMMVIGGGQIYQMFIPHAERMYLTVIEADVEGDTLFPRWDSREWVQVDHEHRPANEQHDFAYSFVTYERR
ncbi:MAG: type 3 dihydrofolate reductase [Gammaproteobacteria bacterium]